MGQEIAHAQHVAFAQAVPGQKSVQGRGVRGRGGPEPGGVHGAQIGRPYPLGHGAVGPDELPAGEGRQSEGHGQPAQAGPLAQGEDQPDMPGQGLRLAFPQNVVDHADTAAGKAQGDKPVRGVVDIRGQGGELPGHAGLLPGVERRDVGGPGRDPALGQQVAGRAVDEGPSRDQDDGVLAGGHGRKRWQDALQAAADAGWPGMGEGTGVDGDAHRIFPAEAWFHRHGTRPGMR